MPTEFVAEEGISITLPSIMIFPFLLLILARVAFASWGYTTTSTSYVVDTGAGLVVTVSKSNGDITSMKYNGVEYNGYDGLCHFQESQLDKR